MADTNADFSTLHAHIKQVLKDVLCSQVAPRLTAKQVNDAFRKTNDLGISKIKKISSPEELAEMQINRIETARVHFLATLFSLELDSTTPPAIANELYNAVAKDVASIVDTMKSMFGNAAAFTPAEQKE